MKRYFCDFCGQEIKDIGSAFKFKIKNLNGVYLDSNYDRTSTIHRLACHDCYWKTDGFWKGLAKF